MYVVNVNVWGVFCFEDRALTCGLAQFVVRR